MFPFKKNRPEALNAPLLPVQQEGRRLYFKIFWQLWGFATFIVMPINLFQELFLIKSCGRMVNKFYPAFLEEILVYGQLHNVHGAYVILLALSWLGLALFLRPVKKFLYSGKDAQNKAKKLLSNPYGIIPAFIAVSLIANTVNFILDFKHFMAIPQYLKILSFINRLLWQTNSALLFTFFFRTVTAPVKEALGMYILHPKDRNFFAQNRDLVLITTTAITAALFVYELTHLAERHDPPVEVAIYLSRVSEWGMLNLGGLIISATMMLFYSTVKRVSASGAIIAGTKNLVDTGDLSSKLVFDDANNLALLSSAFNSFIFAMQGNVSQVKKGTDTLTQNKNKLNENTYGFIEAVSNQEEAVSRMNYSTQNTGRSVQEIGEEVSTRFNGLSQELSNVDDLIKGTEQIISIFTQIAEEYEISCKLSKEGTSAVQLSVDKSTIMSERLGEITEKIREAGKETEGIDEALKVIQNISEQTNLLSMNAAIEAAHGGTSGNGFAQVAEEVRTLAHMSKEAVDRIATRLSAITTLIHESVDISVRSQVISDNNTRVSSQLRESMGQVANSAESLASDAKGAMPIAEKQSEATKAFHDVSYEVLSFLQKLREELRHISGTSVTMSLNFGAMSNSFRAMRSSLYGMQKALDQFGTTEKLLNAITGEFNLGDEYEDSFSENAEQSVREEFALLKPSLEASENPSIDADPIAIDAPLSLEEPVSPVETAANLEFSPIVLPTSTKGAGTFESQGEIDAAFSGIPLNTEPAKELSSKESF